MTEADDTAKRRRKASPASPVVRRSVTLAESVGELSGPLAQQENSATASEDTMSESNGEATTPATTAVTVDPAPPEFAVVGQWRFDDIPIYTSPRYLHRTGPLGFEQTDEGERAEAVQAEATSAGAREAGAREEREERGGQA
ncbi:hypothetical protein SAZ11_00430 [Streptomyces sp. FXJ1.4098]|nr:hypothetical protein [Streptomyces sp. FXJ1.4098]